MIIDAQHHYRVNGSIPTDMRSRLRWMDEFGIDLAVLTTPRDEFGKKGNDQTHQEISTWVKLNDELKEVERQHPDRFVAAPSIPIFDAKSALNELDRVVSKDGAKALFIQPWKWRIDYEYLLPLYEKLDDLRIPLFFHPVQENLPIEGMGSAVGFPFSTTVAISCLLTSGLLDSYRNLKFVIPHLGGALPFTLPRLEIKQKDGQYNALRPPSGYFESFYFDLVSYSKKAVEFAASVFGPDRLVFGSDFGCPGRVMVQPKLFKSFVEGLPIGSVEKEKILGKSLAELLDIEVSQKEERKVRATAYSGRSLQT